MPGAAPAPLSILDLSPVSEGSSVGAALRNTIDLARRAESFGYHRYWVAEHHFTPGVASSSPAVLIGAIAAATSAIRVGSGAVQLGHQTPAAVVEAFGTLAELYPGRIDLGIGRSGKRRAKERGEHGPVRGQDEAPATGPRTENGLLIPPPFSSAYLMRTPRFKAQSALLQQPEAQTPDFGEQVDDILALLHGTYSSAGIGIEATPGTGTDPEFWVLGTSGGQSAQVAGALGLPFAASYHITPATTIEAAESYRAAFRPSAVLPAPYVMVSADAVVAETDARAQELAAGYGLWVRSIRSGAGAMRYPSAAAAAAFRWTGEDRALVEDRVSTQFAGSPQTVAKHLRILQDATAADEVLVTGITHRHEDRVRSFELLAREWGAAPRL
ncbi:MAG TPA: LLM class flavin-dependent oxidoreductase [Trebonia sp.]|jgi:alkanesulfonate monooxygenase SsuD/methylene tetrahydromethanopterin reductase-like flavin-dependent oxidoreductase (luciferase family)